MTGIYIASTTPKAGKSLFTFSLGILLQKQGVSVGYMKPLGRHCQKVEDSLGDTDALIAQELLGQTALPHIVSPIMMPKTLHALATQNSTPQNALQTISEAYTAISHGKDVTLVAGTETFPATGSFCGADGLSITRHLNLRTILVEKYDEHTNYDAILYAKSLLKDSLLGVVFNNVPEHALHDVRQNLVPYLASKGVVVHGIIPKDADLMSLRITDLAYGLSGCIVAANQNTHKMVKGFTIGTMQVDNFMVNIRRHQDDVVIVGGDRMDLQLAALYSNCSCLILTGNFTSDNIVRNRAEDLAIPLMVVQEDTYTVARTISHLLKTKKLRTLTQIKHGIALIESHLQTQSLQQAIFQ